MATSLTQNFLILPLSWIKLDDVSDVKFSEDHWVGECSFRDGSPHLCCLSSLYNSVCPSGSNLSWEFFFFENLNDSDFSELESLLGLINRFVFYLGKRISSLDPFRVFSCKFFIKDLIHSLKELISISPFGCLKLPPRSRP